jgi:hypothetical protein
MSIGSQFKECPLFFKIINNLIFLIEIFLITIILIKKIIIHLKLTLMIIQTIKMILIKKKEILWKHLTMDKF